MEEKVFNQVGRRDWRCVAAHFFLAERFLSQLLAVLSSFF